MSNPKDLAFLLRKDDIMKKIKVLEVNNIDLQGRRFNGYDMIKEISDETIEIKQAVIEKESNNESVVKILKNSNSKLAHAVFDGVETLTGAPVYASDLRAGAALIIAGICAEGKTEVYNLGHIDRGYENIEEKFRKLGAKIERVEE
jgi:UDP-N-acetylglucosamine enolpyruvyl transferase